MKIEKIIDSLNETNIYIVYDEKEKNCIIIDPCNFDIVNGFILKNNLKIDFIVLTHEHFDHILGVNKLIDKYECVLVASEACNVGIINSKTNLSSFSEILFYFKANYNGKFIHDEIKSVNPYICKPANMTFKKRKTIIWNNYEICMYETPGHSKGSISIVIDNKYMFSGDSLLKDVDVITRFPGGSTKEYNNITFPFYNSLDNNMIVHPGHGHSFMLKEKFIIEEKK